MVDPKESLAPLHEKYLSLGKELFKYLPEILRAELEYPEDIEPLQHEFRYAPSLASSTFAEVRSAVAISEFLLAIEGLVWQYESGPQKVKLGDQTNYFVARIANAIACKEEVAKNVLFVLVDLLRIQALSVPGFTCNNEGSDLIMTYNSESEE